MRAVTEDNPSSASLTCGWYAYPSSVRDHVTPAPLEQAGVQVPFQFLDLNRNCSLRQAQFLGSLGEVQMPGRSIKCRKP